MTAHAAQAEETARRLWERACALAGPAASSGDAILALGQGLEEVLVRWVGVGGLRALLQRAHARCLSHHAVLAHLKWRESPVLGCRLERDAAQGDGHDLDRDQWQAAMICLLVTLLDQLGRVIGHDMALRLVQDIGPAVAPAQPSPTAAEGLDQPPFPDADPSASHAGPESGEKP